jgi:hypothetical protein
MVKGHFSKWWNDKTDRFDSIGDEALKKILKRTLQVDDLKK